MNWTNRLAADEGMRWKVVKGKEEGRWKGRDIDEREGGMGEYIDLCCLFNNWINVNDLN